MLDQHLCSCFLNSTEVSFVVVDENKLDLFVSSILDRMTKRFNP